MREPGLSRRALILLTLSGLAISGGCSTGADRMNNLIFEAVKNDPVYSWRPPWVVTVSDAEFRVGGIYPEATPRLSHALGATALRIGAMDDAVAFALSSGWRARSLGGAIQYIKGITNSDFSLRLALGQVASGGSEWLSMDFYGEQA
jgi:hypothetical protein